MKVTGKCGSVSVRLIPAPRGSGIVGAPTSKKLLQFAGVEDCFTNSTGQTRTLENFVKATYDALMRTYGFLTPDLWPKTDFLPSPFIRFADQLEFHAQQKRGPRADGERGRGRGGRGGRGGDRGDRPFRGGDRPFRGGDRRERPEGDRPEGEKTEGAEGESRPEGGDRPTRGSYRGGERGGDRPAYSRGGERGSYRGRGAPATTGAETA